MYTISLLLLLITWTPFYLSYMITVFSSHLASVTNMSPVITSLATLYAPLSALLHGYRNTKVRRELCSMFSVRCDDVATPLPVRRTLRSMSMRESTRHRNRLLRHSFVGELNSSKQRRTSVGETSVAKYQRPDCTESQTLLLTLTSSSAESSARSSFSSGPSPFQKSVSLVPGLREEATC